MLLLVTSRSTGNKGRRNLVQNTTTRRDF